MVASREPISMANAAPMADLNIHQMVTELLDGRRLEELSQDEQNIYYGLTAPFTNGTTSEITDAHKHDASARQAMAGNHIGQGVPTIKAGKRLFWNGPERNYGRAMFDETLDNDCDILAVIPRFQQYNSLGVRSPYDVVIYVSKNHLGQEEVGFFTTEEFRSSSLKFGYRLDFSEVQSEIQSRGFIPANKIIGRNNACSQQGDFQYGHECNVIFCSHNIVSEDQYWISDRVTDLFSFYLYSQKRIPYPRDKVALDLYGRNGRYQPCPLPGEYVRNDGLLAAFRKTDSEFPWLDFTVDGLKQVYDVTDHLIHVDQSMVGYAKVYDVEVTRGAARNAKTTLTGTTDYLDELALMCEDFHGRVVAAYQKIKRESYGNKPVPLSFDLTMFLVRAMLKSRHTEYNNLPMLKQMADRITASVGNVVIGDYVLDFKLIAEKKPNSGDKFSDTHGTKH